MDDDEHGEHKNDDPPQLRQRVHRGEIDADATLIVNFNEFGPSSLNFFVYTFTRTVEWVHYHAVKQDVLLKIADLIRGHGAEIAFP
ncbi:MAG: mechanosensitive ion channel, partial [Thiobacillus sp.]|nr:mechanosensitive ion channel [Thiobacillus sp.]